MIVKEMAALFLRFSFGLPGHELVLSVLPRIKREPVSLLTLELVPSCLAVLLYLFPQLLLPLLGRNLLFNVQSVALVVRLSYRLVYVCTVARIRVRQIHKVQFAVSPLNLLRLLQPLLLRLVGALVFNILELLISCSYGPRSI